MQFNLTVKGLEELVSKFNPQQLSRGMSRSLNRAVRSGKTELSRQTTAIWNLQKSTVDRKTGVSASSPSTLSATITVHGEPFNLMYFNPTMTSGGVKTFTKRHKGELPGLLQKKTQSKDSSGLRVEILKGKKAMLRKSFFIIGKGGTPLVVRRVGAGKGTLQARMVITQASMSVQRKVLTPVKEKIISQFDKEWANQVDQLRRGGQGLAD